MDEGGEISRKKIRDLNRPVALIGVGEKGYVTFDISVEKPGGHSSRPDTETAIDILAKALVHLRSVQTPEHILPPIKLFLSRISGSSDTFYTRMALE